jgi:hypothetical protein
MTTKTFVKDDIQVEHYEDGSVGVLVRIKANVILPVRFTPEEKEALMRALHSGEREKYGIVHPSDRPLVLRYDGEEVWSDANTGYVLFNTIAEAQARIDERAKQYPNGDWKHCRVAQYNHGVPRIHPRWTDVPTVPKLIFT